MKKRIGEALVAFGSLVKEARIQKELSQLELAAKLDMDIRTIQRIESGKSNLRFANFFALVQVLEIDTSGILRKK